MTSEVMSAAPHAAYRGAMSEGVGILIRDWRQRRRVSQLELAGRAGVSTRHVSCIETGRARPTSAMILRLCDHLAVPLREQNRLLLAGGFAPVHPEHGLQDPPMAEVSAAIEQILTAHLPFPALVIDAGWDIVSANDAVYAILAGLPAHVVEPPVNILRLTLDPEGLSSRIANLEQWREHLLRRLARDYDASAEARLGELLREYGPPSLAGGSSSGTIVVPMRLRVDAGELSLLSTTTVFGTPREVTLSGLAIEAFYPADAATRDLLSR